MKKFFIHIIIMATITSCNHYYYMPSTQNVPLFKEKNEYRATISSGAGDETSSTDIQAAYSITNKFALMTNLMFAHGGDPNDDEWAKGHYFDAAFGYFKPLGNRGVFEIYGGAGASKQHHEYDSKSTPNGGLADLSFTKVFIQPSIGLTYNGFDIALTSGISNINFNKINNQISPSHSEYSSVKRISTNRNSFLFEPSFTIRGGW
jgi:hypothetical protein